jgi:uncharacterized protein with von Willebrand factor type A (vWA) domain
LIVPFIYELRQRDVPVGVQEALALSRALAAGLHESTLEGFYHVARALLIHSEAHLDAFDRAFLAHFRGIEDEGNTLHEKLLEWLRDAIDRIHELTPEEQALLDQLDPDEVERMFQERLREQQERHDGGSRWIGTGGTSPFGHSGAARPGIRVGGSGGNRSAFRVASARSFAPYRKDLVLDVRQLTVALRKLRAFAREGGEEELDLEETINATAKNAGELEVVTRPPRRPNTRVVLLMDVGGSMDPHAHLVSRLFSAASKATHFKELRCYYFHNCVYGRVYKTEGFREPISVHQLLGECGPHHKLIVVGDALMAPYELLAEGPPLALGEESRRGIDWLMELERHFDRACWLNPEPPETWFHNTIEQVAQVFDMFPLTLDGLGEAVAHLVRGRGAAR